MDRYFVTEYKEEITAAYREILEEKKAELEQLKADKSARRKELARLYVEYQVAIFSHNNEKASEIKTEHSDKLRDYENYITKIEGKIYSLEGLIERIEIQINE